MENKPSAKILYSLLINALFLCIALFVFRPFFEEIDDTHLAMISEGAYGVREWHLIYTNVILGRLYVLLSTIAPAIRWHVVIQYFFIFLAYFTITYVLLRHRHGALMSFAVVCATFYEMYVSLQYTKTAAFVCTVGFLAVFQYVRACKRLSDIDLSVSGSYGKKDVSVKLYRAEKIFFIMVSFILVIYGSLLRKESFFIACVPVLFLGFLELYRTRMLADYIKILLPMFAVVFIGIAVDSFVYTNDFEWSEFMKYNKARSEFTDYRHDLLYYEMYGDELEKLGVSENDAVMIVTYQFGDDNVFSYERLTEIRNAFPKHKVIDLRLFRMFYGNVRDELTRPNVYLYALFLFIIMLIASIAVGRTKSSADYISESRAKCIAMLLIGVICSAALFYFHYSGRWSHRLVASLVIPAICVIAFMTDNEFLITEDKTITFAGNKKDLTGRLLIVIIAVSAALNVYMLFSSNNAYNEWCRDELISNSIESLEYIKDENNARMSEINDGETLKSRTLYVADTFTFQNVFKYDIFKPSAAGELSNFVTCGSWFMNSPITRYVTKGFGYKNPYEALLSHSDNVILLDDEWPDSKLEYLKSHYDSRYELEKVYIIPGATNYKVYIDL